ncbi:MAG: N-acetylmuramoyl-L-alanine amidase [Gemmatimonadales bacterium]
MLLALLVPTVVVIHSERGEARVPVRLDPVAGPVLAAPDLVRALEARLTRGDGWADVTLSGRTFRLYPGAPILAVDGRVEPLAGSTWIRRDTVEVPLQFLAEVLPRVLGSRFRYDPGQARLQDHGRQAVAAVSNGPEAAKGVGRPASNGDDRLPNGLRTGHVVTIDAGHGGTDAGTLGRHFPRGVHEKDITLALARLVREELRREGVRVVMTRDSDTLIALRDRGPYCRADCDLFVSIHVNAMPARPGAERVRGFETYFLAEARTEDAARVARMENEAIRFEAAESDAELSQLEFILKDLQLNEYLRESARAAELVQSYLIEAHTGPNLGVKQAGFMVLATARRPAILIETGFATNAQDARLLSSRTSRRNLAASIADAIIGYLREYERKIGEGRVTSSPGQAAGR